MGTVCRRKARWRQHTRATIKWPIFRHVLVGTDDAGAKETPLFIALFLGTKECIFKVSLYFFLPSVAPLKKKEYEFCLRSRLELR